MRVPAAHLLGHIAPLAHSVIAQHHGELTRERAPLRNRRAGGQGGGPGGGGEGAGGDTKRVAEGRAARGRGVRHPRALGHQQRM